MAPAGKLSHPASMVAVSGVLILLSVSAAGERQCSWCGPLADQVHRSQRAPSCDEPGETTCENGLSHCAIIASSPPYLESRLCVKYYQDECYSNFCNSSRTWRMTCPCRGDLCNKKKTEREHEAFAFLATLGSKIQNLRIKKRTINPGKFMSRTPNRTAIVNEENGINNTNQNELQDQEILTNDNMTETNTKESNIKVFIDKSNNDSNDTNTSENLNEPHNPNNNRNENNVENSNVTSGLDTNEDNGNFSIDKGYRDTNNTPTTSRNENEVEAATSSQNLNEMVNDMPAITETPVSITQIASQASMPDMKSSEIPTIETSRKDINIDVANNIDHIAVLSTEMTDDEKNFMKMDIKPSAGLPAAEALQQNSSPSSVTEKNPPKTEQTTTESIETTNNVVRTTEHIQVTTTSVPKKMKKNNANTIFLNFLPTLFWVTLYF